MATLVIVGRYRNAIDAELARGALETAGVRTQLVNGHDIAVDEEQAAAAEQIVNAMIGIAHAEHLAAPAEEPLQCEECGSPDVERRKKLPAFALFVALVAGLGLALDNTIAAFFVVLAGLVFFLAAGSWRCRQCGATW